MAFKNEAGGQLDRVSWDTVISTELVIRGTSSSQKIHLRDIRIEEHFDRRTECLLPIIPREGVERKMYFRMSCGDDVITKQAHTSLLNEQTEFVGVLLR
jgi:hypothetical protein